MNKDKKKIYIEEMKNFFSKTSSVFVTHYQGLSVKQIDDLKSEMRKHGILFKVTKNRITKLALEGTKFKKLEDLFQSLKTINAKLWVIEDDKRQCEKEKDFTEKFIKLSRDVHFLNDERAKIKLEINNHTGSEIKEIKEYTNY